MPNFDDISVFLAVLETGSIQGAGAQLEISRPTIRNRLAALEAEVGVPLLYRGADGLRPTVSGQLYAKRAREMQVELEVLARSARAAGASPHGVLRIGMPSGTPSAAVADLCQTLRRMLPALRLEIVTTALPRDELIRSVDCLICLDIEEPVGPFVSVDLGIVREQLVASPAFLAAHEPIRAPKDLAAHTLFGWIAPDTGRPIKLPVRKGVPPVVEFAACTDDLTALLWMAARGQGLALVPFLPELARPPFFEADPPVPVLPEIVGRDRKRRLLVAEAVADLPVIRAFLDATVAAADRIARGLDASSGSVAATSPRPSPGRRRRRRA